MRHIPRLFLFVPVLTVVLFATRGITDAMAQSVSRNEPGKSVAPDQMSQAELQQAYRSLQDQLRATQAAIVNSRLETEANARVQAAALAEKISAMNATLAAERQARQEENDRAEFARDRQQTEIQRSNRSVIWVATVFGSIGLLAMLFAAQFQWRAINRMAQVIDERPLLPYPSEYGTPLGGPGSTAGQPLALSTQRLLSAIDRMEQRIKELEPTVVQPTPTARQPSVEAEA